MTDFDKFLLWEAKSRDTIDFKKVYVDIAGDLVAGLLLSQIIYWYLPNERGETKLRVEKDGNLWIAKSREDWWDEIRITPKQFDRASNILIEKGLIIKDHFRFNGLRTTHIRLEYNQFMKLWQAELETPAIPQRVRPEFPKGEDRSSPKVKTGVPQRVRPLTESTTKNTTENLLAENSFSQNQKQELNQLASIIASDICLLDIETISSHMRKSLQNLTLALWQKGATSEALTDFKSWWEANDWRGKQGQSPTPQQIGDTWKMFEESKVSLTNGASIFNDDGSLNI